MESSHGPTVPDFGEKIKTKPNRKMSSGTVPPPLTLAVPEQDQLPHFARLLPARAPGQAQTVNQIKPSLLAWLASCWGFGHSNKTTHATVEVTLLILSS